MCTTGPICGFPVVMLESGSYLHEFLRYIALNPVRARMVERPEDYRWSAYRYPDPIRRSAARRSRSGASMARLGAIGTGLRLRSTSRVSELIAECDRDVGLPEHKHLRIALDRCLDLLRQEMKPAHGALLATVAVRCRREGLDTELN